MVEKETSLKSLEDSQAMKREFEHLLKQSRESLDFALQSGGMGTWDMDLKNRTITCSKEMLELWGVSPEEFTGQRSVMQNKVHPDDLEKMNLSIETAIRDGGIYEIEYRICPAPGVLRWVLSRGRSTFDQGAKTPTRLSGVVFDITEKKAKEEALAAAMKERDEFTMMASHEFRTPLACLQLQLHVNEWNLKNSYPEAFSPEKISYGIKRQKEQVQRLTRLISNFLDQSKSAEDLQLLQLEQFNLTEMVTEVIEQFKQTTESELHFTSGDIVIGIWDRYRLEQVLVNLLLNALRFGNKKPIHVDVSKSEEKVILTVRDQGFGIRPENHRKVFERFGKIKSPNAVTGMGLGLYISNNIVRAHGGEIRLESDTDKGAQFSVILPDNFQASFLPNC